MQEDANVSFDDVIAASYLRDPDARFVEFDQARPFRHLVMDDFFDADFAQRLLDEFPPFDTQRAMNENGEVGAKCVFENLPELGRSCRRLDDVIRSEAFLEWLSRLTGIDGLTYDPYYFGGGTHENRHGQDLDPHVDFNKHPKTGLHRRLNLIVYLNHDWDDAWGGAIEFHKDPRLPPDQNEIRYVSPRFNRAVLFETTFWSWHGFERISLPEGDVDPRSRKSVALYFYSKTRPKAEQAKPHSTIYVERPIPDSIRPGEVLDEGDFQRLRVLIDRRDQHLQRLYGNIADLNAFNEELITQRDRAMEMVREVSGGIGESGEGRSGFVWRVRRWLARKLLST